MVGEARSDGSGKRRDHTVRMRMLSSVELTGVVVGTRSWQVDSMWCGQSQRLH
jgi:hypothetical protein